MVGAQSRWVKQALSQMGHEVIVANPRQVKLISASQSKNDANDALLLARLARVDPVLLAPVEHRGDEMQMDLTLIRARALLVKQRVGLMHSIRGTAKTFGIRLPQATSERFIERSLERLPEGLRVSMAGLFGMVIALSEQMAGYDNRIEAMARERYPGTRGGSRAACHRRTVFGGHVTRFAPN